MEGTRLHLIEMKSTDEDGNEIWIHHPACWCNPENKESEWLVFGNDDTDYSWQPEPITERGRTVQ